MKRKLLWLKSQLPAVMSVMQKSHTLHLVWGSSLLLFSWDSCSPSPDKGPHLHWHYSSHPEVGTIWDAGWADRLTAKAAKYLGKKRWRSDLQQMGWYRKGPPLSPVLCPNPINASVKQEIFSFSLFTKPEERKRRRKKLKANKQTASAFLKLEDGVSPSPTYENKEAAAKQRHLFAMAY